MLKETKMSPKAEKVKIERRSQTPIKVLLGVLVVSVLYLVHVQLQFARDYDLQGRELRGLWMQINNRIYVHRSQCIPPMGATLN